MAYDLIVIGDGFIGRMVASLAVARELNVLVIAHQSHELSAASWAAGAMLNVDCELEWHSWKKPEYQTKYNFSRLAAKETARRLVYVWEETNNKSQPKLLMTNGTVMTQPVANKSIEGLNYQACVENNGGSAVFPNEWAVNNLEFKKLSDNWRQYAKCTADASIRIDEKEKTVLVGNDKYLYDKLAVTAGLWSLDIVRHDNIIRKVIGNQGVGINLGRTRPFKDYDVYRTANRGGRCGFHVISHPCGKTYIGATSQIGGTSLNSLVDVDKMLSLLTQYNELYPGHFGSFKKVVMGWRPMSIDGIPVIGPITEDIFVVSGTHREGITISGGIAALVWNWATNNSHTTDEKDYLTLTDPLRAPIQAYSDKELEDITFQYAMEDPICKFKASDFKWHFDKMMTKRNAYIPEIALHYLKNT